MLRIVEHSSLTDKLKAEIVQIYPVIFESFNEEKFLKKFSYYNHFHLLAAYDDEELAGFKFGYGMDPDLFYSWTGGVHPDYRKKGYASALMLKQHEWCRKNGYKRIETRTRNKFPEMISLNLKHGFEIVGTFTESDQKPKIILRLEL